MLKRGEIVISEEADKSSVKARIKWSEEEKDAVKEGYKQYPNRWVEIKNAFPHILKDRTSVQIKVCLIHHYYLQKPFC